MSNRFQVIIFFALSLFFCRDGWAIKTAASLEPYLFHQRGDYTIIRAGDKGTLTVSGIGARVGGLFGPLFVGAEGMVGLASMKTTLSPDTVDRDLHPLGKVYDAIGGTLGIVIGRLQLYGTYFFNEKLNYMKSVSASGADAKHDYTYSYFGHGYKFTLAYNLFKGLNIGVGYHKGHLNRYRQKYNPETINNKTTGFRARGALRTETIQLYISWRFGTDQFVTIE